MDRYPDCVLLGVHFLSAPPERKWTESPAVRDPAFRILKAGKEEAEFVTLTSFYPRADIPVRKILRNPEVDSALHRN